MLVSDQKHYSTRDIKDVVQREHRPEAILSPHTKVILREPMGWCALIGGYLHPMEDFLRGQIRKPRVEVQEKAAFQPLFEINHPDTHAETMRSLEEDKHLSWLRMVCLQIANVVPEQECHHRQEMWLIHVSKR